MGNSFICVQLVLIPLSHSSDFLNHIDWFGYFKVQEKFSSNDISWNRAMDEVRTDRLVTKYGKDSLLVIIRDWPVSEKYKDKPEMVASLEYLVCLVNICLNTLHTCYYTK